MLIGDLQAREEKRRLLSVAVDGDFNESSNYEGSGESLRHAEVVVFAVSVEDEGHNDWEEHGAACYEAPQPC